MTIYSLGNCAHVVTVDVSTLLKMGIKYTHWGIVPRPFFNSTVVNGVINIHIGILHQDPFYNSVGLQL